MDFYVLLGKTKAGPYSIETLKARGYWAPDTLVCKEGETEWKRIGEMTEEEFVEVRVKEVVPRPAPPEKLSRTSIYCLALIFPLLIVATLLEEKADFYYREGNYELAEKYSDYVHTCVMVAGGLICFIFLLLVFWKKGQGI